jgi:hypothetical protein
MVEVLGLSPAVLAPVTVTLEDRAAINWDPSLIRHSNVAAETHHRR